MKRLIVIVLVLLTCLPALYARRKSPKSGEIKKNVYTDATYDFKFKLLENWDPELRKPDDNIRLVLQQEDHEIPPDLMQYPQMARVPEMEVYITEMDMHPSVFVDSMVSQTYSSDVKNDILGPIKVVEERISFEGLRTLNKRSTMIDSLEAVIWQGTVHFIKDLGMGETIPRTYAVGFIGVKNGDLMLAFMMSCEEMFVGDVFTEVIEMAESLQWPPLDEQKKKGKDEDED